MLIVVLMMLGGILCGYLFRKKRIPHIQQVTTVLIWALLFLLGLNIGSNEQVINSIGTLGLEALAITIFATLGSLIAAWLLWRYVNQQKADNDHHSLTNKGGHQL
ncbi:MAG: lysine exporter LysO family protein [Bacteroidaceae bacterium]|nr:lysine exporter LysO family protein [Bacteroidaceae bacterium]